MHVWLFGLWESLDWSFYRKIAWRKQILWNEWKFIIYSSKKLIFLDRWIISSEQTYAKIIDSSSVLSRSMSLGAEHPNIWCIWKLGQVSNPYWVQKWVKSEASRMLIYILGFQYLGECVHEQVPYAVHQEQSLLTQKIFDNILTKFNLPFPYSLSDYNFAIFGCFL